MGKSGVFYHLFGIPPDTEDGEGKRLLPGGKTPPCSSFFPFPPFPGRRAQLSRVKTSPRREPVRRGWKGPDGPKDRGQPPPPARPWEGGPGAVPSQNLPRSQPCRRNV